MYDISAVVERQLAKAKKAMIFNSDGTSVYKYPDKKSEVVGWLDMHTKIYILNDNNGFYYILHNLNFGYVPKSCVMITEEE